MSSTRPSMHSIKYNDLRSIVNSHKHLIRESFAKKRQMRSDSSIVRQRYPANGGKDTIELFPGIFIKIN